MESAINNSCIRCGNFLQPKVEASAMCATCSPLSLNDFLKTPIEDVSETHFSRLIVSLYLSRFRHVSLLNATLLTPIGGLLASVFVALGLEFFTPDWLSKLTTVNVYLVLHFVLDFRLLCLALVPLLSFLLVVSFAKKLLPDREREILTRCSRGYVFRFLFLLFAIIPIPVIAAFAYVDMLVHIGTTYPQFRSIVETTIELTRMPLFYALCLLATYYVIQNCLKRLAWVVFGDQNPVKIFAAGNGKYINLLNTSKEDRELVAQSSDKERFRDFYMANMCFVLVLLHFVSHSQRKSLESTDSPIYEVQQ